MTQPSSVEVKIRSLLQAEMASGLAALLLACAMLDMDVAATATAVMLYLGMAALLAQALPRSSRGLGWANRVTLLRGVLICSVAGNLVVPPGQAPPQWLIVAIVVAALALDGLDGWVARRTASASELGARFDMELDAFLILVLCLWLVTTETMGPWVLALGGMRYGFVLAGFRWPWLAAPLPDSRRRRAVCVWQVIALVAAMTPIAGEPARAWMVAGALAALAHSFTADIRWLYVRARH